MAGATFGGRVTSFHYKDITGIEVNTGLITGVIEISTHQATEEKDWWSTGSNRDPAKLSNCLPIYKTNLKEHQPYLEKLRTTIEEAQRTAVAIQKQDESLASQIEKLAQLYQTGALTEEEFQVAKKRLLEQNR